ncbi:hypothetical protein [Streptosporangium saharense]|uniref:hypothetical protein n=1 Tax=Streptosporangium saharense TaxID=1706840 RepID=UPI00368AA2FA
MKVVSPEGKNGRVRPWAPSPGRHRLFLTVLLVAVALRVLTVMGYPPVVWFEDSFDYVGVAERPQPYAVRPSGYPLLLWLLRPLHSFAAVAILQHLMGLATGVTVYALVRRRAPGARAGWAVLAAAPVLLDAYQIFFEHTVLSDVPFTFLVVTAVAVVLWSPGITPGRTATAGLLLAVATLTRSIGLVLLPLLAAHLLLTRPHPAPPTAVHPLTTRPGTGRFPSARLLGARLVPARLLTGRLSTTHPLPTARPGTGRFPSARLRPVRLLADRLLGTHAGAQTPATPLRPAPATRPGARALLTILLAVTAAVGIPLGGYAVWYGTWHGTPALNGGSGVWLWARTMPFADCRRIRPPEEEAVLCPPQPVGSRPASPYFIWSDWSPLRRVPGHPVGTRADLFQPEIDGLAGSLARRAITAQPLDYLRLVGTDLRRTLNWRRGPVPGATPVVYNRYVFPNAEGPLPDEVRIPGGSIGEDLLSYGRERPTTRVVEPAAGVMRAYQSFGFLPGPLFGALSAVALLVCATRLIPRPRISRQRTPDARTPNPESPSARSPETRPTASRTSPAQVVDPPAPDTQHTDTRPPGDRSPDPRVRRRAALAGALPLAMAFALIVGPVAVTAYDSRYWLPAIPLLCLAPALTLAERHSRTTPGDNP